MSNSPLPKLSPRQRASHKGDFGRVLIVGGSKGMAGAVALAGISSLRMGAGLVRLAIPEPIANLVASFEPSYMTVSLPTDDGVRGSIRAYHELVKEIEWADVVAIGPGLGQSKDLAQLVRWLFDRTEKPAIFDADALNMLSPLDLSARPAGPRILTPHPGELRRLAGKPLASRDEQIKAAQSIAAKLGVIVLVKGEGTAITDGQTTALNTTGNPGMATGGSGDALTGIIAALVGQKLSPLEAAILGAHLHGLAGDLAAAELGEISLIASDLPRFLPRAIQQYQRDTASPV
ncbi:carbohydrate kinase, YjeF related protein [Pirellula staleyi DSM 6068]|uniref:ADP-dependent (S)-NAD(P)H-hydrate dehydratase n=1 Tax=Pirellula staleyi (strain ATCC 27377 / DSM 6068 / ICPB 4128) TaxID=530564 RepID=D2R115_PIRSD|nr:NAD(P)H-hydrate dehydratase [Pirellula staleyi]ADB18500.1 carbohydrate kinase, YjeF related protein [Pirellula staleyi DSM 6068]